MTTPISIDFVETDLDALAEAPGKMAILVTSDGKLDPACRRVNRLTKGAVARAIENDQWEKVTPGEGVTLAYPVGLKATSLKIVKLDRRPDVETARKAGATLAKFKGRGKLAICAGSMTRAADLSLGLALRAYEFTDHKTAEDKPSEEELFGNHWAKYGK